MPTANVEGDVTEATKSVEMRFNLESWLLTIDYDAMLASSEDPFVIKAGAVSHDAVVIRMVSTDPVRFVFTD